MLGRSACSFAVLCSPRHMLWAQGVGRLNRPAPTNGNKSFICKGEFSTAILPGMNCGTLRFLGASGSYQFDDSALGMVDAGHNRRLSRWSRHAAKSSTGNRATLGEITKTSIYLLTDRDVFQNISYASSGPHRNGVTRIELCIVEIQL
jgi:hypothetical protein